MKISVSYGETINTGNFNSKKINLSMEYDILVGSDRPSMIDEEYNKWFTYLKSKVQEYKQQ